MRDSGAATSTRDLVSDVRGYDAACIAAETSMSVRVTNATVDRCNGDGGSPGHKGTCVLVGADSSLSVTSSILTSCRHYGVLDRRGNLQGRASVAYSIVGGDAEIGRWWNTTELVGNLDGDPRYERPAELNFQLQPGSPSIDMGDPGADCDQEPHDRAGHCRIDMGHLGNTPLARTNDPPE